MFPQHTDPKHNQSWVAMLLGLPLLEYRHTSELFGFGFCGGFFVWVFVIVVVFLRGVVVFRSCVECSNCVLVRQKKKKNARP